MKNSRVLLSLTLALVALLALFVASAPPAMAQATVAWSAQYFANQNLTGDPVLTREDPAIDFVWGSVGPGPGVPGSHFSARWRRWYFIDAPGLTTFTTRADGGVRLWVDSVLLIDQWNDGGVRSYSATTFLTQAFHLIQMEYFHNVGSAEVHLTVTTAAAYPDWKGEYYANDSLSGAPVFVRNDPQINFNWDEVGPGGGIPPYNFSVRWTRALDFSAGAYRFTTTTDDGVRLWVDSNLLIDRWQEQTPTSWAADIVLTAGMHIVRMEYFQHGGGALARLVYTSIPSGTQVWHGEYWDNMTFSGNAVLFRDLIDLSFNYPGGSPGSGISATNWSARFTRQFTVNTAGYYTFYVTADDGVRLWVDDGILINEWHDQSPTSYAATKYMQNGTHNLRVEYYQHLGGATLIVTFSPGVGPIPPPPPPPPPGADIIVEAGGPGWFQGGMPTAWHTAPNGHGGLALWTNNNTYTVPYYNWGRWYANIPAPGFYSVQIYIPGGIGTTHNARYWISHAGNYDLRPVNQALYANQWVEVGVFFFNAGSQYVSLADVTYEPAFATTIVFDSVKFSPR